jgi:hypothetical protein
MPTRLRSTLFLLLALTAALVLAACGGDDAEPTGQEADAGTDVDTLLKETFSGEKKVDSGRLQLNVGIDANGAEGVNGPLSLKLNGPFASQGEGKVPKFKFGLEFSGQGQQIKAGATSTGDKAFVNFNGKDYAVSEPVFKQFRAGYEEAQKQAKQKNGKQQSLTSLGIDPRKWLTGAKNEGEEKVGDADTIRITGGVDVPKLLDDVNVALEKAGSLGLQGTGQVPQKLTEQQRRQVAEAVKDLKVEIFTGKEDKILRRMIVDLRAEAPADSTTKGSATVKIDFSLLELNDDQKIAAPSNTRPLDDLLKQFGGLGALGGGSGSGSSGSGSSGQSAEDQKRLKEYTDCVTEAGSDTAKAQDCAKLLTP